MDKISKEQRSNNMSAIRSTGNKSTEIAFLQLLKKHRIIGWRRHQKKIFGNPDFIFKKEKVTVFIDGCFWHGCRHIKSFPKQNFNFWNNKIIKNRLRDKLVNKTLKVNGWIVVRIWEHQLIKYSEKVINKLSRILYEK